MNQKRQLEAELESLRNKNREDVSEIEKLTFTSDQKGKESVENAARIRQLEYDIQQSLSRIDELNRVID